MGAEDFAKLQVSPESKKESKVLLFIPAGELRSEWLTLANAWSRMLNVQTYRNPWPERGEHGMPVSFAEVVRGPERSPEVTS